MAQRRLVFGDVGAGRDLSFLSQLKPELPGDEYKGVEWMSSCHLISAYCDYLFRSPGDTLAGQQSEGGRAHKEGRIPESVLEGLSGCPRGSRGADNTTHFKLRAYATA